MKAIKTKLQEAVLAYTVYRLLFMGNNEFRQHL